MEKASPLSQNMGYQSPKMRYTEVLLEMAMNYFKQMSEGSDANIEYATIALITFVPNKAKRQECLDIYDNAKKESGSSVAYASSKAVGEVVDYLTEVLELSTEATAGLM